MKERLRQLLLKRSLEEIADWACQRHRVLGMLVSQTFDADPLVGWRAVEAMGVAADRIADTDPGCVRNHLRRLYWLLSEESGGICWRSPEAMAEILRHRPQQFRDYIPIVVFLLREMAEEDLEHFRPGIVWAIGRLGTLADKETQEVLPLIEASLKHDDPQVRGVAVWCLQQCGQPHLVEQRRQLFDDEGPVELYLEGQLTRTSVRQLCLQAHGLLASG